MEVAELGLESARMRGYGTCSRSDAPPRDIARGSKIVAFFHSRLLRRGRMEVIMVRNKWFGAWDVQFECQSDSSGLGPGAVLAGIPPIYRPAELRNF